MKSDMLKRVCLASHVKKRLESSSLVHPLITWGKQNTAQKTHQGSSRSARLDETTLAVLVLIPSACQACQACQALAVHTAAVPAAGWPEYKKYSLLLDEVSVVSSRVRVLECPPCASMLHFSPRHLTARADSFCKYRLT